MSDGAQRSEARARIAAAGRRVSSRRGFRHVCAWRPRRFDMPARLRAASICGGRGRRREYRCHRHDLVVGGGGAVASLSLNPLLRFGFG